MAATKYGYETLKVGELSKLLPKNVRDSVAKYNNSHPETRFSCHEGIEEGKRGFKIRRIA